MTFKAHTHTHTRLVQIRLLQLINHKLTGAMRVSFDEALNGVASAQRRNDKSDLQLMDPITGCPRRFRTNEHPSEP